MLLTADDVAKILQIPKSSAYPIIRRLNDELKEAGFYVLRGRVEERYFLQRFRLGSVVDSESEPDSGGQVGKHEHKNGMDSHTSFTVR